MTSSPVQRHPDDAALTRALNRLHWGSLILMLAMTPLLALGCQTRIHAPAEVADPTPVYIIDYGRHSSLALPGPEDEVIEYAYGEWQYFALRQTGILPALRALLVPSQGTLGRRVFDGPIDEPGWRLGLGHVSEHRLEVDRPRMIALRERLEERWHTAKAEDGSHQRIDLGMMYVRDPQPYSFARNCNPVLADWVQELGADVRGPALFSNWRIIEPDEPHEPDQPSESADAR